MRFVHPSMLVAKRRHLASGTRFGYKNRPVINRIGSKAISPEQSAEVKLLSIELKTYIQM
ncbi:hypothetical protein ABM34_11645 [Companilactobacillus ginsenosidimutans]|uniref:Uncharacterized protein n=1 Tax=Companilactobacillus ginsenosidimutans TaxID=1007676 RepID=A0A0H4QJM0_9LACO|nr:hypothetical protein ABM34_11645 [Companilactobacillus ginsenosidimutans]